MRAIKKLSQLVLLSLLLASCMDIDRATHEYGEVVVSDGLCVVVYYPLVNRKNSYAVNKHCFEWQNPYKVGDIYPRAGSHGERP